MLQNIKIGNFYYQSSYMTMFYVGCIFFIILLCWKKHREVYGIPLWKAAIMSVISIALGYATTSLMFGLENGMQNFSGYSWYGAVFFMPISYMILFWFVKYIMKLNTLEYVHNLAAPLAMMNGFMKVGCTLYGCCFGYPMAHGLYIYNAMLNRRMFPIQPIEAALNFAVCGFILWYERKPGKIKYVYPLYMIIYSVGRFACEFGRQGNPIWWFLTGGMIYALMAIVIGIIWILIVKNIEKKEAYKFAHKPSAASDWRHKA
ncbi:MAG: prolipoprotein diacylglyceryl transferase [Oscillospiraceae bacterium]|nr:prolipoprotein diacylglyceryl transferase [Oscillospiraceae bacterium]